MKDIAVKSFRIFTAFCRKFYDVGVLVAPLVVGLA
jgi:hypothetical protein